MSIEGVKFNADNILDGDGVELIDHLTDLIDLGRCVAGRRRLLRKLRLD